MAVAGLPGHPCRDLVLTRQQQRQAQGGVEEKPMRIVRRQVLGMLDAPNGFRVLPQITIGQTRITPGECQVRIQGDRAFMRSKRAGGVFMQECLHMPGDSKAARIVRVQLDRAFRQVLGTLYRKRDIIRPALPERQQMPVREP